MKRLLVLSLALIMLLSLTAFADETAQVNSIIVKVNGEKIDDNNLLYAGRSYVPMRKVFEKIGCTVDWDQATATATITGEITKVDNSDFLSTYEADYNELKGQYDAFIASKAGDAEAIADLEARFEIQVEALKEKYKSSENNVVATTVDELPEFVSVLTADGQIVNAETNAVKVVANGTVIKAANILYNDSTFIPLRAVAEELGCTVEWEDATSTASITGSIKEKSNAITFSTYEEGVAYYKNKYEVEPGNINELKENADRAYAEALDYTKAAGGQTTKEGNPQQAWQISEPERKLYEDKVAEYEKKIADLKAQFGIKD